MLAAELCASLGEGRLQERDCFLVSPKTAVKIAEIMRR